MTDELKVLGKYVLKECIGRGAMGSVWLSSHPRLNLPVAIKILEKDLARESSEYIQQFIEEGRTAAALNHTNIVRIYDADHDQGYHYLVMEYIDGCNIQELADQKGGMLSEKEVVELAIKVSEALQEAHSAGIVHRDIKPENIMVTKEGKIKLADLGIAKKIDEKEDGEAYALGTPYYISPEQAIDARQATFSSDIYSLGASMYHLLTGVVPFTDPDPKEILKKHISQPFENPKDLNPILSDSVCTVIDKMTKKKPDDRYEGYKSLISDLNKIKHKESIPANESSKKANKANSKNVDLNSIKKHSKSKASNQNSLMLKKVGLKRWHKVFVACMWLTGPLLAYFLYYFLINPIGKSELKAFLEKDEKIVDSKMASLSQNPQKSSKVIKEKYALLKKQFSQLSHKEIVENIQLFMTTYKNYPTEATEDLSLYKSQLEIDTVAPTFDELLEEFEETGLSKQKLSLEVADHIFAQFGPASIENWNLDGDAFGTHTFKHDYLPEKLRIKDMPFEFFVCSLNANNSLLTSPFKNTGRMTSKEFVLKHRYINLFARIGESTRIVLLKKNSEEVKLTKITSEFQNWHIDVKEYIGQKVRLAFVDDSSTDWIGFNQIIMTNSETFQSHKYIPKKDVVANPFIGIWESAKSFEIFYANGFRKKVLVSENLSSQLFPYKISDHNGIKKITSNSQTFILQKDGLSLISSGVRYHKAPSAKLPPKGVFHGYLNGKELFDLEILNNGQCSVNQFPARLTKYDGVATLSAFATIPIIWHPTGYAVALNSDGSFILDKGNSTGGIQIKPVQESLVGRWKGKNSTILEFFIDGTFVCTTNKRKGTWRHDTEGFVLDWNLHGWKDQIKIVKGKLMAKTIIDGHVVSTWVGKRL